MVENLGYHLESPLSTSESAKRRTESSQSSKLVDIAEKLANYDGDDADELRNLIETREYKKFQNKIGITNAKDLDGQLGPKTFDLLNNYIEKNKNTTKVVQETQKELDVFKDYVHKPEHQQLTDSAKIHKNAREYLSNHESLSEEAYNTLFSGKELLQQGQVGNCYLVSGLIELANTQYFDTLMRTSITRVQFKNDNSLGYNIRIPLGEPHGRDILIKDSEISMAKINGNIGYKLLEMAYVKNRRKNDKEGNRYSPVTEWEYQATRGGTTDEVLRTFLGRNNISFSLIGTFDTWTKGYTLSTFSSERQQEIRGALSNFDSTIGDRFISLVTPPAPGGDSKTFSVGGNTLYNTHVYALDSVSKNSNGDIAHIKIKNPWNRPDIPGGTEINLTFPEFMEAFAYIGIGKIKSDTFLDEA